MEQQKIRFGSPNSRDKDAAYVFQEMPSMAECKEFCRNEEENRNIIVLEDGVVRETFKGLPDEMNNSLYYTFDLHDQSSENPILKPIKRIIPLKVVRANRIALSMLARTQYRSEVKQALSSYNFNERIKTLGGIDFRKAELDPEQLKAIAFQLGQTLSLIGGVESYTKDQISAFRESLSPFLARSSADRGILNDARDELLARLRGVYTRKDGDLTLLCYMCGPSIGDWNGFISQSRGMVIDMKKERCIYFPYEKFFRINEVPQTLEDRLPLDEPAEVVEKLDGSMISCFRYDEEIRFACKGNFDVQQARKAKELAEKQGIDKFDFDKFFPVFELIYPENRFPQGLSIVDYGDRTELALTGLRNRLTNEMMPYSEVVKVAQQLGLPHPSVSSQTVRETIELTKNAKDSNLDREGYVALLSNGQYVKIKFPGYMRALKTANELRAGRFMRECIKADESKRTAMTSDLPENMRGELERQLGKFHQFCSAKESELLRIVQEHGSEFPRYVTDNVPVNFHSILFNMWRGKEYKSLLEKRLLREYHCKEESQ